MKSRIAFAAGLALALALPAFAQDDTQNTPSGATTAPATAPQESATDMQPADTTQPPVRHVRHSRKYANDSSHFSPAAMSLTGNEPGTAAYQASNRDKYASYPVPDRAHVPGDPPVIDHSGDHATVADPTHTSISVPPDQQR